MSGALRTAAVTAADAYAGYLRKWTGAEPETMTGDRKVTVIARRQRSALTITFQPAAGCRQGWQPASIIVTRDGGQTAGYATGQLARAVADLLAAGVSAETPAAEGSGA